MPLAKMRGVYYLYIVRARYYIAKNCHIFCYCAQVALTLRSITKIVDAYT